MKIKSFFTILLAMFITLTGCQNNEPQLNDQLILDLIEEDDLTVLGLGRTSKGVVYMFYKTTEMMGAYTLYYDENNKLVISGRSGLGGTQGGSEGPLFTSEENKTLLTGFLDGSMGLIIDEPELLERAAYFVVKLDNEVAATVNLYPGKLTYIIEIDSFIRSLGQKLDTQFLDKDMNEIKNF